MKLDDKGANDPRENDVVHLEPGRSQRSNDVVEDMVGESVELEHEEDLIVPASEVG